MLRTIIHIDEEKCNGCGACARACHEGAIAIVKGKARLLRDDYCDGMGDCLPECPMGAITFEEREAAAYDPQAVAARKERQAAACPGSRVRQLRPGEASRSAGGSQLQNWPVQLKLAPVKAPYFDGARLLIAADCTAYAYAAFHNDFLQGRVALIGCPKLDGVDYSEKLAQIFLQNDIREVTVVRMEVPCCGGLEFAVQRAVENCGKDLRWRTVTVNIDGTVQ